MQTANYGTLLHMPPELVLQGTVSRAEDDSTTCVTGRRLDDPYLLMYLRHAKFDTAKACARIAATERWLRECREEIGDRVEEQEFEERGPGEGKWGGVGPRITQLRGEMFKEVYGQNFHGILGPYRRTREGATISLMFPRNLDALEEPGMLLKWNAWVLNRAVHDPYLQICGQVVLESFKDFSLLHSLRVQQVSSKMLKKNIRFAQECMPYRLRGLWLVFAPKWLGALFAIAKPFLSAKLRSRVRVFKGGLALKELHEQIDPSVLPLEFGGSQEDTGQAWFENQLRLEAEEAAAAEGRSDRLEDLDIHFALGPAEDLVLLQPGAECRHLDKKKQSVFFKRHGFEMDLPAELEARARRDLGETPESRVSSLQALRDHFENHPEDKPHRLDDPYLLMYLRHAKFDVAKACARIAATERWLRDCREEIGDRRGARGVEEREYEERGPGEGKWGGITQLTPPLLSQITQLRGEMFKEVYDKNFLGILGPYRRTREGATISLMFLRNLDALEEPGMLLKWNAWVLNRAVHDPYLQVCGQVVLESFKDFSVLQLHSLHAQQLSSKMLKKNMRFARECMPFRVRGLWLVFAPKWLGALFAIAKPFLSAKIRSRVRVFKGGLALKELHEQIDPSVLPLEFGGSHEDTGQAWFENQLRLEAEEAAAAGLAQQLEAGALLDADQWTARVSRPRKTVTRRDACSACDREERQITQLRGEMFKELYGQNFLGILGPYRRTREGATISLMLPRNMEPLKEPGILLKWNAWVLNRAVHDPYMQICGQVVLESFKDFSVLHSLRFQQVPSKIMKKNFRFAQECMPFRLRGLWLVFAPKWLGVLFAITKPFLSAKLRSRVRVFKGGLALKELHEQIDPSVLPREFGGSQEDTGQAWFENQLRLEAEEAAAAGLAQQLEAGAVLDADQ
ncbi:Alpha-tocopherol transfer protein-like [Tetrabaena socialis]|uniref:Alpha-tocopherol transfer protein-like n=1 Tax=Tetrabaena socialis TaxID=47790 RepID=A0A2J8AED2_9CHLO|nr:Alpha-tocopherol transfer protein-like [Tetrabaena socialis]|eukprot:PNH10873.1 Alpha-tocopherol transfer protein-like [Tetrabaena socialis]